MAQPYVGEIRMFAGNFPPAGWLFCDGQLLPISENEVLFQLIGTTYGGDGESTFALPNLQSRIPIHMGTFGGNTFQLAESAGTESVTLTTQQIPIHTHPMMCSSGGGAPTTDPTNAVAAPSDVGQYSTLGPDGIGKWELLPCQATLPEVRSHTRIVCRSSASTSSSRSLASFLRQHRAWLLDHCLLIVGAT